MKTIAGLDLGRRDKNNPVFFIHLPTYTPTEILYVLRYLVPNSFITERGLVLMKSNVVSPTLG